MASIHLAGLFVCLLAATVVAIPEKCHIPDEDWEELVDQFPRQGSQRVHVPRSERGHENTTKCSPDSQLAT
ncbi:hypothetical protein MTO96_050152 [Rhipicephalus appendiculatus]